MTNRCAERVMMGCALGCAVGGAVGACYGTYEAFAYKVRVFFTLFTYHVLVCNTFLNS